MNLKHTESEKTSIIARYHAGETVAAISSDTGIPRSTIYDWLKDEKSNDTVKKTVSINGYRLLENKVSRLQGIIEILKRVECSAKDPLDVKLSALEALQSQYSVRMLCEALGVPRGTFYNHILRNKRTHTWYAERREELRLEIQRIYDDSNQIFGAGDLRCNERKRDPCVRENGIRAYAGYGAYKYSAGCKGYV